MTDPTLMKLAASYAKRRASRPGAKAKFAANPIADLTAALKAATAAIKADPMLSSALPMSEMSQWSAAIKNGTISEQVAVAAAMRVRAALQAAKSASGPTKVASPKKPAVAGQSVIGRAMDRLRTAASTITTKTVDPTSQEYKDALAQAKEQAKQALGAYAAAKAAHNTALGRLDAYVTAAAKTISAATSVRDVQHYLAAVQDATRTRSVAARSMPTPFARKRAKSLNGTGIKMSRFGGKAQFAADDYDFDTFVVPLQRQYRADLAEAKMVIRDIRNMLRGNRGTMDAKAYDAIASVLAKMEGRVEQLKQDFYLLNDTQNTWNRAVERSRNALAKLKEIKARASSVKSSRPGGSTVFAADDYDFDTFVVPLQKQYRADLAEAKMIVRDIRGMLRSNPGAGGSNATTVLKGLEDRIEKLKQDFYLLNDTQGTWNRAVERSRNALAKLKDFKTKLSSIKSARPGDMTRFATDSATPKALRRGWIDALREAHKLTRMAYNDTNFKESPNAKRTYGAWMGALLEMMVGLKNDDKRFVRAALNKLKRTGYVLGAGSDIPQDLIAWTTATNSARPGTTSTHAQLPEQTLEGARQPGGGAHSEAVSRKIKTLIDEGKPQDQAVAIALDLERRGEL